MEEAPVRRAAALCKCDLLTDLVGEFPRLQGICGGHYARHGGESEAVAVAIGEHYHPAFAGDTIPAGSLGRILALSDKLDSIVAFFAIGERPGSDKDPYGLRRAALGCLRILIEGELPLPAEDVVQAAVGEPAAADTVPAVLAFLAERLRAWYLEQGCHPDRFDAVLARGLGAPLDFHRRMQAVAAFLRLPEAAALAAANKRIGNLLRKADAPPGADFSTALLREPAEQALAAAYGDLAEALAPLLAARDYVGCLQRLAQLQPVVDRFFDEVLVMCEDAQLCANRLALLRLLADQCNQVADLSRLAAAAAAERGTRATAEP